MMGQRIDTIPQGHDHDVAPTLARMSCHSFKAWELSRGQMVPATWFACLLGQRSTRHHVDIASRPSPTPPPPSLANIIPMHRELALFQLASLSDTSFETEVLRREAWLQTSETPHTAGPTWLCKPGPAEVASIHHHQHPVSATAEI